MQDVRLAFRALRAAPIITAAGILSLALGIGANAAVFSIVNSLLLRSLQVETPERLVAVTTTAVVGYLLQRPWCAAIPRPVAHDGRRGRFSAGWPCRGRE